MAIMIHMGMQDTNYINLVVMDAINDAVRACLDRPKIFMIAAVGRPEMRKGNNRHHRLPKHVGIAICLHLAPPHRAIKPNATNIGEGDIR